MSSIVTVAILSDTHGCLHNQVREVVSNSDIAIHAGDICNADILDALQPKSGQVIAVSGNNDQVHLWPAHQVSRLQSIPEVAALQLPGGLVKIEHGHSHDMHKPDHEHLRQAHPDARLIVYGHTHRKIIDDFAYPWVVNPGAAGATRTRGGASCLVLTASEALWKLESFRFDEDQSNYRCSATAA